MQQPNESVLVLLQLAALALPTIVILMQVLSEMTDERVGIGREIEFLLARWSLLLFVISATVLITYLSITQLPSLLVIITVPMILALLIFAGSIAYMSGGFIDSLKSTGKQLREKLDS